MTRTDKTLAELLEGVPVRELHGQRDVRVRGLAIDSRLVEPGDLFVALPGQKADGHGFVQQAARQGACAAVVSRPLTGPQPGAWLLVDDTQLALARLAANFHGHPSASLSLVGITGTNGKTTLTYLLESVIHASGGQPGVIGTVEVRYAGLTEHSGHTTPQAHDLQAVLARMVAAGVGVALLEVSSHALALQRVRGCHFQVAVFTNFSRDHLDFHGDLERYAQAKQLLFARELVESRAGDRVAVINGDDPRAGQMLVGWPGPIVRYSLAEQGDVHPVGPVESGLSGIRARVACPAGTLELDSCLIGRHNLENLLAAVAVGCALGVDPAALSQGLAACRRVPGRLERVAGPAAGPAVFVDYAHTDHALINALAALRPLTQGRLMVVFGCGGDRDRGKRPLMGAAVAAGADLAIVTSDNPRSEDPQAIIEEILPGLSGQGWRRAESAPPGKQIRVYLVEPDRRTAIGLAMRMAREQDVVLIAGKGHETYQVVGQQVLDFDDRIEAQLALHARPGGRVG